MSAHGTSPDLNLPGAPRSVMLALRHSLRLRPAWPGFSKDKGPREWALV
ncbi:hypothetical protein ACHFCA_19440 [Delftia tsuruhatensis]